MFKSLFKTIIKALLGALVIKFLLEQLGVNVDDLLADLFPEDVPEVETTEPTTV